MNNAELIKKRTQNILKSKGTNVKNLYKLLRADLKKLFKNYLIFDDEDLQISITDEYEVSVKVKTQKVIDFGKFID